METYQVCCGLDVHRDTVVACLRRPGRDGARGKEVRTCGTMTAALLELATWFTEAGCTHVAMESTGLYWRPVYHVLEGTAELLLVNALHVQRVRTQDGRVRLRMARATPRTRAVVQAKEAVA